MKPTYDIPPNMLDNGQSPVFKNDFFQRFTLRKAARPLQLTDRISKDYLFPTFYGDVTCAMGIFLCSYKKAEALIAKELHPKIKPVRMTRGRAIIAFSCYEYKNVMNVLPYNEVAMAIPVMVNAAFSPPLLPMIMKFSRSGYYIAGMPVTSRENQIRGNRIWGLPKVTQRIDMEKKGSDCVTTVYDDNGGACLILRVPVKGTAEEFDETSSLYSRLEGKLLRSETNFRAVFNVNKHMDLLIKKGVKPDRACIEIGRGGSAELLKDLEIEEHPFQTRYAEHMSSCFDLPCETSEKWFEELNRQRRPQ